MPSTRGPKHWRRLVWSLDRIVLFICFIVFGVWSFFAAPERIYTPAWWERLAYVEMVIAGLLGLAGTLLNKYWPTKIGLFILSFSFSFISVVVLVDGGITRGKLWVIIITMFLIWSYRNVQQSNTEAKRLVDNLRTELQADREPPRKPDPE